MRPQVAHTFVTQMSTQKISFSLSKDVKWLIILELLKSMIFGRQELARDLMMATHQSQLSTQRKELIFSLPTNTNNSKDWVCNTHWKIMYMKMKILYLGNRNKHETACHPQFSHTTAQALPYLSSTAQTQPQNAVRPANFAFICHKKSTITTMA